MFHLNFYTWTFLVISYQLVENPFRKTTPLKDPWSKSLSSSVLALLECPLNTFIVHLMQSGVTMAGSQDYERTSTVPIQGIPGMLKKIKRYQ
jgi:hypothetical protein